MGYMEPGTYLELEGVPHSRTTLRVEVYNKFSSEMTETFDPELYNEIVKLQAAAYDGNQIIIKDVKEHFGGSSAQEVQLLERVQANNAIPSDTSFF
jgi:hypothetical protein